MTLRQRLRSSASHRLQVPVPPVRLSTVGQRALPVAGANTWNDLPLDVTSTQSLAVFRQRLKTFLFLRSYIPGHPDMTYLSLLIIIVVILFVAFPAHGPCNN